MLASQGIVTNVDILLTCIVNTSLSKFAPHRIPIDRFVMLHIIYTAGLQPPHSQLKKYNNSDRKVGTHVSKQNCQSQKRLMSLLC